MEDQFIHTSLSDGITSVIPGIENAAPIPVLYAESLTEKEFVKNWVDKSKPCLIKGAIKHWSAMSNWKEKDYWIANSRNENVKVGAFRNFALPRPDHMEEMPFHDAVERLFAQKDDVFKISARVIAADTHVAALEKDTPGFPFLPDAGIPRKYPRKRILMYHRASSNWHFHPMDETLMCQVSGSKRITVFPPHLPEMRTVSRFLDQDRYLSGEQLDPSINVKPMTADVEEGDAMYIPPFWYHGLYPTQDEVGFTLVYCWKSPWHVMGDMSNYLLRDLYKRHPYMFKNNQLLIKSFSGYAWLRHLIWKAGQ